ncbi:hypothetical protein MRB53_009430 [Persea americana]|uniref:Uncharacterized protein n=1 Tax=Persea americana TaxID=3435 RepID=A0ACC2LPN6_PERAE|nr:hypothetical protein MRB53_009430 [Persea americana]
MRTHKEGLMEIAKKSQATDGWESRWVKSDWKRSEGKGGSFKHIAGQWPVDPDDRAHASNVEERNAQCRHISHSFMSKKSPYAKPSHITVCLEDLNYRMQGIDTLPARSLIQRNLLKSLFHQKHCWNRIDTFARSPIKDFSVIRTFKCIGEGTRSLGSC